MQDVETLNVGARIHGRVLVRRAPTPAGALLGFHGYYETADVQLERLAGIPGSERWTLIAIQGLHRFYRGRTQEIAASWMTRQDRELAIADNVHYVDQVVTTLGVADLPLVCIGFSQGVSMAFRGAVLGRHPVAAAVGVGGDVPPELLKDPAARFPRVLLARGTTDQRYPLAVHDADVEALRARGVDVQAISYPAGHDWHSELAEGIGRFLQDLDLRSA